MAFIDQIREFIGSIDIATLNSLGVWSYFLLAFLVAIEGPIATLLGAVAASAGILNPFLVFIAAGAGNLTSDTLWYTAGLLGKMDWLLRLSQRLGVNPQYLERLEVVLQKHAPVILFVSKLTISPMIPALIATGLIRYPWRRWFPYVFLGEMIWTGSLVLIGYFGLQAIHKVQLGIEHFILGGTIIMIVLILWLGRGFLKREIQQSDPDKVEPENKQG